MITQTETKTYQIQLQSQSQVQTQKKKKEKKEVQWTEETVDNENMGKLKSKACCIYHKPHSEQSESDDTCSSDDDINAIERDRCHKIKHKQICSKQKQ